MNRHTADHARPSIASITVPPDSHSGSSTPADSMCGRASVSASLASNGDDGNRPQLIPEFAEMAYAPSFVSAARSPIDDLPDQPVGATSHTAEGRVFHYCSTASSTRAASRANSNTASRANSKPGSKAGSVVGSRASSRRVSPERAPNGALPIVTIPASQLVIPAEPMDRRSSFIIGEMPNSASRRASALKNPTPFNAAMARRASSQFANLGSERQELFYSPDLVSHNPADHIRPALRSSPATGPGTVGSVSGTGTGSSLISLSSSRSGSSLVAPLHYNSVRRSIIAFDDDIFHAKTSIEENAPTRQAGQHYHDTDEETTNGIQALQLNECKE